MSLFIKKKTFSKNMFSKHALFWQASQLKAYQNNSKFNLTFFDKQVSPSSSLFWAVLHQGAVPYGSPQDNWIYHKTSVGSLVSVKHITF